MIQRKQHLFLLLITITSILFFFIPICSGNNDENQKDFLLTIFNYSWRVQQGAYAIGEEYNYLWIFLTSISIIPLFTIFQFNNRKLQLRVLNVFYAFISIYIYLIINRLLDILNMQDFSIQHIDATGMFKLVIPFLWLIFNFMAIRGIQHDEDLIKSADRIR